MPRTESFRDNFVESLDFDFVESLISICSRALILILWSYFRIREYERKEFENICGEEVKWGVFIGLGRMQCKTILNGSFSRRGGVLQRKKIQKPSPTYLLANGWCCRKIAKIPLVGKGTCLCLHMLAAQNTRPNLGLLVDHTRFGPICLLVGRV